MSGIFPKHLLVAHGHVKTAIVVAPLVVECAGLDATHVYQRLQSSAEGLSAEVVARRLAEHGPNVLGKDQRRSFWRSLWQAVLNPLVLLLAVLASLSLASGDARAAIMMGCMILLGVGLKLIQESKADGAAAKLKAMISVAATVIREGTEREVPIGALVPGDVVRLAAGDMIPGDVRIVQAKDLFVTQGSLTGESLPVEKCDVAQPAGTHSPLELPGIAFLGTSVESGSATAVVVVTGKQTYLGRMALTLSEPANKTAFERDVSRFTGLMLRFMLVMVPLVFLINGFSKGNWREAFFFAVAVAVGLTPEMLPMIVTVCLSNGAVAMGKRKVIVKRLNAIQNLGAMDVLCVDKTGTLTMDQVILERHCDVSLRQSQNVLALAYTNSHFQTGLRNVLDRAVLAHEESHAHAGIPDLAKVDEIPFDFQRRIMSVVVRTARGTDLIISKGAPEAIFPKCTRYRLDTSLLPLDQLNSERLKCEYERLSTDGFRVLAIATREVDLPRTTAGDIAVTAYGKAEERELVLEGYIAFLDPPKDSARPAIVALQGHGVSVKVITGDNLLVARKVCREVGLAVDHVMVGDEVDAASDEALASAAEQTTLFARVSPAHKQRIIKALQSRKHIVGFMGDGINDAPALHVADVGISVDTAVDIAKEAADLILLEKSLLVLDEGVMEGRRVFANIVKYVRMGASSNFGNAFSMLGASIFLPFLPMLPIQILANNLLYDIGQTAVPTDLVDAEQIQQPRAWDLRQLTRFIALIGPCSSIFDYTTFFILLYVFNCWDVSTPAAAAHSQSLFQSGWFVESLLTQGLIIHIIRTDKVPFLESRPSSFVLWTSVSLMLVGIAIPFSALGRYLGFIPLPSLYWPLLGATLVAYCLLTQTVKAWLVRSLVQADRAVSTKHF